jgi:hypothetical protein
MEFRQRKTLSVWLATPPWDLKGGDRYAEAADSQRARHSSDPLAGDTQALSLTSPAKSNSSDGWSVIMPAWNDRKGRQTAGTCRRWWKMKRPARLVQ